MEMRDAQIEKTGYILWEGPSRFNGRDICTVVTFGSNNEKTGELPQVWILPVWTRPNVAFWETDNPDGEAICGDCKHRQLRSCYVNWTNAPGQVWRKYIAGGYPKATKAVWAYLRKVGCRMGSAGDPCAVPWQVIKRLQPTTCYTHQWTKPEFQKFAQLAMASCDTPAEANQAKRMRWRPFEIILEDQEIPKDSIMCPAMSKGTQCIKCRLCCGNKIKAKGIVIPCHGTTKQRFISWRQLADKQVSLPQR
jgi:hypothetical protein